MLLVGREGSKLCPAVGTVLVGTYYNCTVPYYRSAVEEGSVILFYPVEDERCPSPPESGKNIFAELPLLPMYLYGLGTREL